VLQPTSFSVEFRQIPRQVQPGIAPITSVRSPSG